MPADERSVNFAEVVVEAAPAAEEPSMMQRLGSLGGSLKNMIAGAPAAADAADPNENDEEESTVAPLSSSTTVAPLREATAMKEASERHILPDEEPVNLHSEAPFCNYVMVRMSIGFLVLWLAGAALIVGATVGTALRKLRCGAGAVSSCARPNGRRRRAWRGFWRRWRRRIFLASRARRDESSSTATRAADVEIG